MNFSLQQDTTQLDTGSSVILPLAKASEGNDVLTTASLKAADKLLNGAISNAIASGDLSSKFKSSQLFLNAGTGPDRILVIGIGVADQLSGRKYRQLVQAAWSQISINPGLTVLNQLTTVQTHTLDLPSKVRLTVEAMAQACYRFDQFKTTTKDAPTSPDMILLGDPSSQVQLDQSVATAQAMNLCRDLGNLPGNICTPSFLAEQGHKLAAG